MAALKERNFNPRAPRGARHVHDEMIVDVPIISIHVPREGHDGHYTATCQALPGISIHVPREGHDRP